MIVKTIEIGNTVICDFCNGDFTESDECGGLLSGSYAICPRCAPAAWTDAKAHGEEGALKRCPDGMRFREWVLSLRGGDNTIRVIAFDDQALKATCVECKKESTFTVNQKDYKAWQAGQHIQDAFPYLLAAQREMLISQICPECFDRMFKEPFEEEADAGS